MGRGMMGPMGPVMMMRMIFALMDGDGDGTLSLQEFQAAHERILRPWMPTKMAVSLWRRCRPSCTEREIKFPGSSERCFLARSAN